MVPLRVCRFLLLLLLCWPDGSAVASAEKTPPHKVPFIYYLQGLDRQLLVAINPAVAVIDPYDSRLRAEDIAWLQAAYGQKLLAYLSVGEVDPARKDGEDGYAFQPGWESAPWLTGVPKKVQENSAWASRRVEFWQPAWQSILAERIKEMAARGYDGAMLDTVDSYASLESYYSRDLRRDMADLVARLRREARTVNPRFLIYINSGMELYDSKDSQGHPFLDLMDGQLKEDTWYNEKGSARAEWTEDDLAYLRRAVVAGKPVFLIDYFTNASVQTPHTPSMDRFMKKARALGAIPFVADRSLGKYLSYNEEYYKNVSYWDSAKKAGVMP